MDGRLDSGAQLYRTLYRGGLRIINLFVCCRANGEHPILRCWGFAGTKHEEMDPSFYRPLSDRFWSVNCRVSSFGVVLLEQVFGDVISRIEFQCFIQYPVNLGVISRLGHFRQPCV